MAESVQPYPRWEGVLASGDRWPVIVETEVRRAWQGTWTMAILVLGIGLGIASVIQVVQDRASFDPDRVRTGYFAMLNQLRWFALAMAAAMGGPSLLEDARRGALELYLSRSVGRRTYLLGKAAGVLALSTVILVLPLVLYFAATLMFFDTHPEGWYWAFLPGIAYALGWGLLVTGLALGVSSVARSSRGAALLLFGVFAGSEIVVSRLLSELTGEATWSLLSPFAAYEQVLAWLFPAVEAAHDFPIWWGATEVLALTVLGWALFLRYRPRLRGEEA